MAGLTPKYIDATNLKALAMLAFVGALAYVVVGGLPVVGGSPLAVNVCWRSAAAPSMPPMPMDSTALLGISISAPFSFSPS